MSKVMRIIIISIMLFGILVTNTYAVENDIFKIDVPSDYVNMSYSNLTTFVKEKDYGIMIYTHEAKGLKKNISTMSNSEINEIITGIMGKKVNTIEKKKEKLGKSKAIKARVNYKDDFMDVYILVSDKHIILATFVAPTEEALDSSEFIQIKKSFKMKEITTNATLVKIGGIILLAGGAYFTKKRKRGY